jgi:peptidyl-prolyl cis-trans isomerase C
MTGHQPDAAAKSKRVDDYVGNELLFRKAAERGMHRTDNSTKQRLIDRVCFMSSRAPPEPDEDQFISWYAARQDIYRAELRVSLRHVFVEQRPADEVSMLHGMFGEDFLEAVEKQRQGKGVGPVHYSRGWHHVLVTARGKDMLLPYTQAGEQVMQDYQADQTGSAVNRQIARLKEGYAIHVES